MAPRPHEKPPADGANRLRGHDQKALVRAMLSADQSPREAAPILIPGLDGQTVEHHGWERSPNAEASMYAVPSVSCLDHGPAAVEGVTILGGVHSLAWHFRCEVCGWVRDYPATRYTDNEAAL